MFDVLVTSHLGRYVWWIGANRARRLANLVDQEVSATAGQLDRGVQVIRIRWFWKATFNGKGNGIMYDTAKYIDAVFGT